MNNNSHIIIIFLLTIVTINLFLLDLKVFSPENTVKIADISTVATPVPSEITKNPASSAGGQLPTTNNLSCPSSCLSIIQQATSSSRTNTNAQLITNNSQPITSREYYIPLGSGSTSKSDWEDIIATETIIDPANYGNIKNAYFIVSLKNPTQNGSVEAQLYNVTDKHMVWGSSVSMNGPISQTITSGKITISTGSKLYRVQLKSTLGFSASLENAKVRIISE